MNNQYFNEQTNHDGRPVLEIKSFADIEKLKEYVKSKIDIRVIMKPKQCVDNYFELVKAMDEVVGKLPTDIREIRFRDEIKN